MKKRIALSLVLALALTSPVYAEEPEKETTTVSEETISEEQQPESQKSSDPVVMTLGDFKTSIETNSDAFSSVNNDAMFQMMKNSMDAGESISLGEAFSMTTGLTVPSNFMYDLSDSGISGEVDVQSINLQYAQLLNGMNTSLNSAAENLSAKEQDATALFKNNYGDLSKQLQIGTAKIPDGFSFAEIANSNTQSIYNAYSSALNSSDYGKVRKSLNVESIFTSAQKGVKEPNLISANGLKEIVQSSGTGIKAEAQRKKNENFGAIQDYYDSLEKSADEKKDNLGWYDPDGSVEDSVNSRGQDIDRERVTANGDKVAWAREQKRAQIQEELQTASGSEKEKLEKELAELNMEALKDSTHTDKSYQEAMALFERRKTEADGNKEDRGKNEIIYEQNEWLDEYFGGEAPNYVKNNVIYYYGENTDKIMDPNDPRHAGDDPLGSWSQYGALTQNSGMEFVKQGIGDIINAAKDVIEREQLDSSNSTGTGLSNSINNLTNGEQVGN